MANVRAPELIGRGGWIGAAGDFGLPALRGKVVVIHFWTHSCINCQRVLGELRPIEERFSAEAVVIGVHSPKFPREHDHESVERAVERLDIRHAVLDDPDLTTWQHYAVKAWPTVVVVDPEGYVIGGISGEGGGPAVFAAVEKAVAEHDERRTLVRGPVPGLWGSVPMTAGRAGLASPGMVAVDGTGRRLAISDTGNDRVLVCDLHGRVEQLVPLLSSPQGVRFDGDRLLVCDTGADRLVAVDRPSGNQTVLASDLASPWDVTVLEDGSLLVAEAGRHRLWRLPPDGPAAVEAGTAAEGLEDGPALSAVLAQPSGVAALPGGGAVFVDAEGSALRVLTPEGTVTTLVGQGLFDWGASDGGPESAAMQHPLGIAAGTSVYVADTLNSRVRVWRGPAWSAEAGVLGTVPVEGLDEPGGLAVLPDGRLVIADTNHHRIVVVDATGGAPDVVHIDESWLGTVVGEPAVAVSGEPIPVPYAFDPGEWRLDNSAGPAVRIDVSAEPPGLLGPGPRRWAFADPSGSVDALAGGPGDGILVVEVEVAVCNDEQRTVLRARSRYDLTVT